MIRMRLAIFSLFSLFVVTTSANAVNKDKLRKAAALPSISFFFSYGISGRGEFVNFAEMGPKTEKTEKIEKIEKELKGDSSDAERYRLLGQLHGEGGQAAKSKDAFRKSEKLYRKLFELRPKDNVLRLRLADVLDELNEHDAAEALFRRAVKDYPDDWHSWVGLGRSLDNKTRRAIAGGKPFQWSPDKIVQSMRAAAPTADQIALSRQYRKEAVACFDRAVNLAPHESAVYRMRGASIYHYTPFDFGLRSYKGEKLDILESVLGREALPDLRKAVDLRPQEYKGIGLIVLSEALTDVRDRQVPTPSAESQKKLIDLLSESAQKRVRADLARLEKGVQNPDKQMAADAMEVLGVLQLSLLQDHTAAEKYARQCLILDPERASAWDLLFNCLMDSQSYRKTVAVCRQRLARRDSAHTRLLLAKAYEASDQFDNAEAVIRVGLNHEPDDFMLKLALADVLLMHGNSDDLQQAGQILYKMNKDQLPEGGNDNPWGNYKFACGIYFGLTGDSERAHSWLESVQKRQPDYPRIKDALKALDEPDEPVSPRPRP